MKAAVGSWRSVGVGLCSSLRRRRWGWWPGDPWQPRSFGSLRKPAWSTQARCGVADVVVSALGAEFHRDLHRWKQEDLARILPLPPSS